MSDPSPRDCVPTGRLRWAVEGFSVNNTKPERKLQQEWLDTHTRHVWWMDLPEVELSEANYAREAIEG